MIELKISLSKYKYIFLLSSIILAINFIKITKIQAANASFVTLSDPQYPWTDKTDKGE